MVTLCQEHINYSSNNRGKNSKTLSECCRQNYETIAKKRLRLVTKQIKNIESSLPTLINYYNECQSTPGATTFYGREGVKMIWNKVIATKAPYHFVRSCYDEVANKEDLDHFKKARIKADIHAENIAHSEFASYDKEEAKKYIRKTTNQDELQKATNNHRTHRLNLWFALQKRPPRRRVFFYNSALYCPVSRNIIPCDS